MKKILLFFMACSLLMASDLDMNAAINASYGNSYDFYTFSENRLDMNFFYNDLQGWNTQTRLMLGSHLTI